MPYTHPELLAEPEWLADHASDPNVRIIDCATLEAYRRGYAPSNFRLTSTSRKTTPPAATTACSSCRRNSSKS